MPLISVQELLNASFDANAATLHVSAFSNDAGLMRVSAIGVTVTTSPLSADSSSISAKQGDAGLLRMSARSDDAGLMRVSAVGGTAGDRTLVDGTSQTISATLTPISASPAGTAAGLVTNAFQYDAGKFHTSSFMDSGSVSAKSSDANQLHVSSVQSDAGLLRVSAILAAGVSSVGAASFGVSASQMDAGALHVSAFVDSGSVSAKSADANQMHVSAINQDANLMHVSAQIEADTLSKGGTNLFSTSAGIAQLSAIKTTADGRIYGWALGNPAGVDQYLQIFFASATSAVTLGTTVPNMSVYVPTLGGNNLSFTPGVSAANGITIAATSTAAGNTAGASAMRINLFYG